MLVIFTIVNETFFCHRPMQRKLVTLVNCQLVEAEGRARAVRSARSLGERSVTELILQVMIMMMMIIDNGDSDDNLIAMIVMI